MITKVTEFLEYKKDKDSIADSTVNAYRRVINEFLNLYRAANERTIKDYLEYLSRSNASARTINFKMSVMNQYQMYITGCKKSRITRRIKSHLRTTYSMIDYSELMMHLYESNQLMYLACLFVSNGIKLTEFKYIKYDDLCEGYIVLPDMKYKLDQIHESVSPHIKANVKRSVIEKLSKLNRLKFYELLQSALDELGLTAYPASSIVLRDTQLMQDLTRVNDICMLMNVCNKYRMSLGSLSPYTLEAKLILGEKVKGKKLCRQSKFLKYFPDAPMTAMGIIDIHPCHLDNTWYREHNCANSHGFVGCGECLYKFWLSEAPDDFLNVRGDSND